jgi:nitroreductase
MTVLASPTPVSTALFAALTTRRSTRAFDPRPLPAQVVRSLLEAARWAPSALNRQPWRFFVGQHGDATHAAIVEALAPGNAAWAAQAPLLVVSLARLAPDDSDQAGVDALAAYETGMATAHLEVQAQHLGLASHHMGGYDADAVRTSLRVPANWRPMTVLAIGRPGDVDDLPDELRERESAPRSRLALSDLAYADAWGQPVDLP